MADNSCFIGYAAVTYNACWRMVTSKMDLIRDQRKWRGVKVEHGVKQLLECRADIEEIRIMAARYLISDYGKNDRYLLNDTPSYKKVLKTRSKLSNRIKTHPNETFLIIYALAGHGMQVNGRQVLLVNDFDKNTAFYRMWGVENDIRTSAKNNHNSYQIALFACCREIHSTQKHSGLFGGSE